MNKKGNIIWLAGFFLIVCFALALIGHLVIKVDPFFHYHKPAIDRYYYQLNNERSQNDGIIRHFDYDAIITGTSMTQNFRASSVDRIFGVNSIKIPFSGGTYYEINNNLSKALAVNPGVKMIIRGLDMDKFFDDKEAMREDLGEFPTYLYDDNVFNDVEYVFNRNVIFDRVYSMIKEKNKEDAQTGITTFDAYANWMSKFSFGIQAIRPNGVKVKAAGSPVHLTDEERDTIRANIRQNVTELAQAYPDVDFYYFFTPYSILWWQKKVDDGSIYKQIEAEQVVIEEILTCDNIKLFSFNHLTDITTDINNYKDLTHYGIWINELMLKMMKDQECILTTDNYQDYLSNELAFYTSFEFEQLNAQQDYENDLFAGALLNESYYGVRPFDIMKSDDLVLCGAERVGEIHDKNDGVICTGVLQRDKEVSELSEYLWNQEYIGARIQVDDISDFKYLSFYGRKISGQGQPSVYIYDAEGKELGRLVHGSKKVDGDWHHYIIYIADIKGPVTIIFNGGAVNHTGSADSQYAFSELMLY